MPAPADDVAAVLSRKAAADEDVLTRLADVPEVLDEILGFHAQQAVEKLLKAVLAYRGIAYERTHNIAYLLELLDRAGIAAPSDVDREALIALAPWAAQFRYEDEGVGVLDRSAARHAVGATRRWAEDQLAAS